VKTGTTGHYLVPTGDVWFLVPGQLPNPVLTVPITVLLYDGPLLCGINVAIDG